MNPRGIVRQRSASGPKDTRLVCIWQSKIRKLRCMMICIDPQREKAIHALINQRDSKAAWNEGPTFYTSVPISIGLLCCKHEQFFFFWGIAKLTPVFATLTPFFATLTPCGRPNQVLKH